jgi:hypothetical protein
MQQHDQGSPFGLDDARAFIDRVRFTYAESLPEHPHEYLARARLTPELQAEFDAFLVLIERVGYTGRFWQQMWRYFDLDGIAYWPSQSWYGPDAGQPGTMLNRCRLSDGQLRMEVGS